MANYAQWLQSSENGVKRMSWLCGQERVLVEEIVDWIRRELQPSPLDTDTLYAGTVKDSDIWDALNQYPTQGTPRLLIVRDAERVKKWDGFSSWVQDMRLMPNNYIVFVSNELDFDTERPVHRLVVDKSGWMVKCSQPAEELCVAWLQAKCPMDYSVALGVLEHCGGDLALAGSVAKTCALFGEYPSLDLCKALCPERQDGQLVDYLMAGKTREALAVLPQLPPVEYSRCIGLLDHQLSTMLNVSAAVKTGSTPRDLIRDKIAPQFLASKLYGLAKMYDRPTVERRQAVLTLIDGHLREGAREGVMEALCALW